MTIRSLSSSLYLKRGLLLFNLILRATSCSSSKRPHEVGNWNFIISPLKVAFTVTIFISEILATVCFGDA
ncbi:hypothetical protein HanHA300_Chr17g0639031 [Helianthus annuus]|nr:hypothetical protein HanHA300_Chr17g0639031 [Helianthus annuus]KAJ0446096.1 hypothetical protein HanHA89_Chr17g0690581 [Helianthus annuus]